MIKCFPCYNVSRSFEKQTTFLRTRKTARLQVRGKTRACRSTSQYQSTKGNATTLERCLQNPS